MAEVLLLVQTLLYFLVAACGLAIAIPMGISMGVYDHANCLLYADMNWEDQTTFVWTSPSKTNCSFPMYLAIISGCIYGVLMGGFCVYRLRRKEPNIGFQMWVWPYLLMNAVLTGFFFIAACIVSVGFKSFCDSFVDKSKGHHDFTSCSDLRSWRWRETSNNTEHSGKALYTTLYVTMISSWVMVLVKCAQVGLGIVRVIKNRRMVTQAITAANAAPVNASAKETSSPSAAPPADLDNVASTGYPA